MSNQVYISQDANEVNLVNTDKQIVITEIGNGTSVNVTQPITSVITVASFGPQGQPGLTGPQGPSGSLQPNSTGSFGITGSLMISGSNPLTAMGPVVFTGSLNVTQGITGSLFGSASYALTASYALNVPETASYTLQALSSSYALTASYTTNISGGSTGYVPLWKSNNTLGTSSLHQDDGNVGIGVLLPEAKLHVKGPGSTDLYSSFIVQNSNGNPSFVILGSGHVGIENLAPAYEFDVTGTGRFTNGLLVTGSLRAPSITGSLQGTASNAVSSSYALTASYLNPLSQDVSLTGNLTINGTASIKYLDATYESASIIYSSGSNQFGDAANDTQTLYGTVRIPTGSLTVTGSVNISGSSTFYGTQIITGSNGRLIYKGTTPEEVTATLAEIHANNDLPWLERFYNDTFSTSSAVMAYYGHNDGRFVFHNESTQSIGLQVNGFNAENGLLVYSNKVAFVNNVEVTGSLNVLSGITGSLFGTASYALTASYVKNAESSSFASTASFVTLSQTASYVLNAISSSFSTTSSYAQSSSVAVSSSHALSSSYALNSTSASYALTASYVNPLTQSVTIRGTGTTSATTALTVQNANASSSLVVLDNGNAGIGTSTPNYRLDVSGSGNFTGALTVGTLTGAISTENTLNVYPSPAGGTGEGGQILLAASGGLYTSASMLDTWQNQFRILKGTNASGSSAGLVYVDLQSGNTNFTGAVTASAYSGLPNTWLHATRNSSQTIASGTWADRDIVFNTYSSNNFTYNSSTGIATLQANKTYRITARVAWAAAALYVLKLRLYNQTTSTFTGPTVEMIQSPNSTYNISDGTLETIFAVGASNVDISIRTTSDTTALTGEYIRGDLNTQLIIQQIA